MRTIKNIILAIFSLLLCTACEKDGDKIYLSSVEGGDLITSDSEVVLAMENSSKVVLSLAWTNSALKVSDASMSAPDVLTTTVQVSATEDFAGNIVESVETSLSKAYMGADLNTIAKNLGAEPDVPMTLYFRLKASVANNMQPVYSNVVWVTVTSYTIDMSIGFVLDANKGDTEMALYSKDSNGDYVGFMGVSAWYNYFLREGDGTVWGNDGDTGTPFQISSSDTKWNFWFPGHSGCYYVDVNTNKKVWSALYIPTLTVSGDVEGEMTFDRSKSKWMLTFSAAKAGNITLKVAGTGMLYDYTTGTDKSDTDENPGIETPVGFAQNGENLIFGKQTGDITVNIPAIGESILVIDLSDSKQWTALVVSGSDEPVNINPFVYLLGIDDGTVGSWTFDNYLRLYDEDILGYAGVVNVNSLWGYQIAIEKDNWGDIYTLSAGDTNAGTLVFKGETNLPAPDAGLYFMNVSLKGLTYALAVVTDVIYCTGFNDDWSLQPMVATETPGVYRATVEATRETPWGFQIVLDDNWKTKFGGSDGTLLYQGNSSVSNIAFDKTSGTYTLTVNLIKGIYTIE